MNSNRQEALRTLGLNEGSSETEIKSTFRRLALKWHPDKKTPGGYTKQQQQEEFKKIRNAYEFLIGLDQNSFTPNEPGDEKQEQLLKEFWEFSSKLDNTRGNYRGFNTRKKDLESVFIIALIVGLIIWFVNKRKKKD